MPKGMVYMNTHLCIEEAVTKRNSTIESLNNIANAIRKLTKKVRAKNIKNVSLHVEERLAR